MLLLSKSDINDVFTMKEAIEADKEAFRIFSDSKSEVPLRTNIQVPKYDGSMLFMPGYASELDCGVVKIVSIFPKNAKKGKATAPGTIVLLDGTTGEASAVLDGTLVTRIRTGAASGAAFDVLAKKQCKIGAVIGTGGQAPAQIEAMLAARELEEVRVFSRNQKKLAAFAAAMNEQFGNYGAKIIAAESSDEAIADADLIIAVTPSTTPVFDGSKVKKGATVSCVGSYMPHMQEMDPVILQRADKLFFDSKEAVLSEAGDILIPLEDGTITKELFSGDLGEVLSGKKKGRDNDEEIIVFKSVGIAVQDLVTSKFIYDKAMKNGKGTTWVSE